MYEFITSRNKNTETDTTGPDISCLIIFIYDIAHIYIYIYIYSRVIQLVLPSRANPPRPSVLSILNIESSALHCGHHFFPP
jgi:hypothetical protein